MSLMYVMSTRGVSVMTQSVWMIKYAKKYIGTQYVYLTMFSLHVTGRFIDKEVKATAG